MSKVLQLLAVSDAFLAAPQHAGLEEKTVSYRVFRDAGTFRRLRSGGDLTTRNWDMALKWFSDNWPEGAMWPDGVPRPQPSSEGAAA
jgi:hypothetical protein